MSQTLYLVQTHRVRCAVILIKTYRINLYRFFVFIYFIGNKSEIK